MNSENPLVVIQGNRATTTSLIVAEYFGKQHKNVMQSIENLLAELPEDSRLNFQPRDYTDDRGKSQPMYEMNRDGFSLLAMGFTGKEALVWKLKFLKAFNLMEDSLSGMKSLPWQEAIAVFPHFHELAKTLFTTKRKTASSANDATRNLTGVDLFKLMNIDQNSRQYKTADENITLLNGLTLMMDTDNLKIRDTFKGILDRLALIISPDSIDVSLPTPRTFRLEMERLRSSLEVVGITFEFGKHTNTGFTVELTKQPPQVVAVWLQPQ